MRKPAGILFLALGILFSAAQWSGAQWLAAGKPGGGWIAALTVNGQNLFAAKRNGGVFLSTDKGVSWKSVNTGLPKGADFQCLAVSGTTLLVGTVEKGVFLSSDNGGSWTEANSGLPKKCSVFRLEASGTNLFAVAGAKRASIFRSCDDGANWTPASSGLPDAEVLCLAASGPHLFAGTGTPPLGRDACVFLSTDMGDSWKAVNAGLPAENPVFRLAVLGGNIFAGSWHSGRVFRSGDNGASWTPACFGLPDPMLFSLSDLAASGTNLFLGSFRGVLLSTNGAASWTMINSGLPADASVSCLAVGETDLFAGTEEGEVWRLPLLDLSMAANLSDPILSEENWTTIRKDKPEAVFIPEQIKSVLQESLAARQGRQDIPFSIVKCLFLPARSAYGYTFMLDGEDTILIVLPERVYQADDFFQAVFFFKAKNVDLGFTPKAQLADPESGQKTASSSIHEAEFNVFIEFRQSDANGTSRVVREVFVPGVLKEDSAIYDPDKENWYSASVMLRPGKYTVTAAITSKDLKKAGARCLGIDIPGPESYSQTLEMTPPFFVTDWEQMKEPDPIILFYKGAFTYTVNRVVPSLDNILSPGEELRICYCVLGAALKQGQEEKIDLEAVYEVQNQEGAVVINWKARNYDSAGINQVLAWDQTATTWDEKAGREVVGELAPGKYTLLIKVRDRVSGVEVEKRIPFEIKERVEDRR